MPIENAIGLSLVIIVFTLALLGWMALRAIINHKPEPLVELPEEKPLWSYSETTEYPPDEGLSVRTKQIN